MRMSSEDYNRRRIRKNAKSFYVEEWARCDNCGFYVRQERMYEVPTLSRVHNAGTLKWCRKCYLRNI